VFISSLLLAGIQFVAEPLAKSQHCSVDALEHAVILWTMPKSQMLRCVFVCNPNFAEPFIKPLHCNPDAYNHAVCC
jgi:hypothetical protein